VLTLEATGAILGKVAFCDFGKFRSAVGEASAGISYGVTQSEGTMLGFLREVGWNPGDGVEGCTALMSSGYALEKGPGVGVEWIREQFTGRCLLYDASGIHDINHFTALRDHGKVMRDQDDRESESFLSFTEKVKNLLLNSDIKGGGGFVGDQDFGLGNEGHCYHHPLTHTAGKLMRIGVDTFGSLGDSDFLEGFNCAFEGVWSIQAFMNFERLCQLSGDPEIGIQRRHGVLKDHGYLFTTNAA